MLKKNYCLYPTCSSKSRSRGLCERHYHRATYHIRSGRTTWEKLEAVGKARTKRSREISEFEAWLLEDREEVERPGEETVKHVTNTSPEGH